MPFNSKTDANITISKKHKEMLKRIAAEQKRTLRATIEMIIEDLAKGMLLTNAPIISNTNLMKARNALVANKPGPNFEDNIKRSMGLK